MSRSYSQGGSGKGIARPATRNADAARGRDRERAKTGVVDGAPGWERHPLDIDEDDIDPAELEEFMSAGPMDVQADPVFKERLRQKLWRIVRERARGR